MTALKITVVPIGPGSPQLLTLASAEALRSAKKLVLRTDRHGVAGWLKEQGISFTSLDDFYDRYDDFDQMHQAMAVRLWTMAEIEPVVFAVMDPAQDGAVAALAESRPEKGELLCLAGPSLADACLACVPPQLRCNAGYRVIPASSFEQASPDPKLGLMITEIDNSVLAGDVKLVLSDLYDDEMMVCFFPPSENAVRHAVMLPLCELDRQKKYDHTTCVYLPAVPLMQRSRYCFRDLIDIMEQLRGQDGCPWDREQTHESLKKYLVEEAYEVLGAIDEDDSDHMADELGDVLLQVVFHASVGKTYGEFGISDVTSAICKKMIYRHAHVFGDITCKTAQDVSISWEKLKKTEKGLNSVAEVLMDVPHSLPALMRAEKVNKKAGSYAGNTSAIEDMISAVETAASLRRDLEMNNCADPVEEKFGQLLLLCAASARKAGIELQLSLQKAIDIMIDQIAKTEKNNRDD